MMKKAWIGIAGISVLIVVVAMMLMRESEMATPPAGHIKVGVILNLTGGLSQADTPKKKVLEAGLAYLKKKAPASDPIHAVELVIEDCKTDPKAGLAAFRKLYNEGIRIFITGTSFNAMSLFPVTEDKKCLLFGVSGHPDFGKNGKYAYRMYPRVETGVSYMLKALKKQGNPSVYVFYTDEPFGQSYATVLKEAYAPVIAEEPFKITQSDFKDAVAKLMNSEAERIVVIGFGIGEKNLLKQMIERKVLIPVVGSEVFYYASLDLPAFSGTKGIADFFEATVFLGPTLLTTILSGEGSDFIDYYKYKTGDNAPQLFGVFAADSLVLLRKALTKTRGDATVEMLSLALSEIEQISTFSGRAVLLPTRELEYELGYYGLDHSGHVCILGGYEK